MQDKHLDGSRKKIEKEECNVEREGLNTVESIDAGGKEMTKNKRREKKALREAPPACDYERIRAANIAERMELLRRIDVEGAVAGAKEGSL